MSNDNGFSLIELMVVVLLVGVLGGITTTVVVNGFHRQATLEGRAVAIEHTRTALQRVLRDLREADPLLALTSTSAAMEITTSSGQVQVCYALATASGNTALQRTQSLPGKGCTDPGAVTATIADHLDNLSTTPATAVFATVPGGFSPSYSADPQKQSAVNSDCSDLGVTPPTYSHPECIGKVAVEVVVAPIDTSTGAAECASGAQPRSCDIDLADSADLRNAP